MSKPDAGSKPGNTRIDEQMDRFLDGVVGVVDANSFEQHMLWCENRQHEKPKTWEQINPGLSEIVGQCADVPVCISLFKVRVGGHLLLFVHATSQVVDHRLIGEWMEKALPATARRGNGYVNRTNAMNFHNVFPRCAA